MSEPVYTERNGRTYKDGKPWDTILNYMWTRYVGGVLDGEEIVAADQKKKVIKHGEDEGCVYSRRTYNFGAIRVVAFVAVDHPKEAFWPFQVLRQMAKESGSLMKTTYQDTLKKGQD